MWILPIYLLNNATLYTPEHIYRERGRRSSITIKDLLALISFLDELLRQPQLSKENADAYERVIQIHFPYSDQPSY
jgi:hypothetical protein